MFTLERIKAAFLKVKSGADFPKYVQVLISLGVVNYETYVTDGHTDYFGKNDFKISSERKYEKLAIADKSNISQFEKDLKEHQQGKTDFLTFCGDSANAGVEKWIVNMSEMTCTYFDKKGNEMLAEMIPMP